MLENIEIAPRIVRPAVCCQGIKELRELRDTARWSLTEQEAWDAVREILQIKYKTLLEGDSGTWKLLDGYHQWRYQQFLQKAESCEPNFSLLVGPKGGILKTFEWVYSSQEAEEPADQLPRNIHHGYDLNF